MGLTDEQKKAVLADFAEWSGGFHPSECDVAEVESYVEFGADADLDEKALEAFLEAERTK